MWVYALLGVAQSMCIIIASLAVAKLGVAGAIRLHDQSFLAILHAPISFFDTTPLGRIINRFSKDQDVIDTVLMDSIRMFSGMVLGTIGTFVLIEYIQPWFFVG